MSVSLMSKSFLEEPQKQGIVSILGCSDSKPAAAATTSLRRALSADMSSAKWLCQSQMKKVASSSEFSNLLLLEDDCPEREVNAGQFDIWSSIVSQNDAARDGACPAPYVHPLVKRSGSGLSEKSLEVCTESLGSETGSDGFSGDPIEEQHQKHDLDREDARVGNYHFAPVGEGNYHFAPVVVRRPFPPPLPSLTSRRDGPSSLRVMPRRENGRLVLEAVSVSAQNNFRAERENGRLVLSFLKETEDEDLNEALVTNDVQEYENIEGEDENEILVTKDVQEYEYIEDEDEDEDEDENENKDEKESQIVNKVDLIFDQRPKTVKLHRLAMLMNPSWTNRVNDVIKCDDDVIEAVPVNDYNYCWRAKPTTAQAMEKNSDNKHIISKNNSSIITNKFYNGENLVLIKGKKSDYITPSNFNGCKDDRRSLFWEPYCIAT